MKKILIIVYLIILLSVIGILTWQLFFQSNMVNIPQKIDSLKLSGNIKGQQAINEILSNNDNGLQVIEKVLAIRW
ncbi:MAG: hypothetical protein JM58_06095 [Peptococcaceae bacterium BICA1-8]|nr:MAG: hypothetical protein JM58_06095 [Peptococcaceae bacterium BICA1-8]